MTREALLIDGCPQKNGVLSCTSRLFLDMLTAAGWHVDTLDLYNTKLGSCRGCLICRENGRCVIEDDAMIFAERFLRADLVVMAAPTFFKNIPGPAKNFLDRFSGTAFDSDLKPRFSHDTGYLLMTSCGAPAIADHLSGQSAGAIRSMRSFFDMSGMRYRGSLVLTDANKIKEPPVSFRRKMLRLARRL